MLPIKLASPCSVKVGFTSLDVISAVYVPLLVMLVKSTAPVPDKLPNNKPAV